MTLPRMWIRVPNGTVVRGRYPGSSAVTLLEHALRDDLARKIHGATEATLPYGRPDVLTSTTVFEVEPWRAWRHATRQVLAYAMQTGCTPAVALFGAAHRDRVLELYLRFRDGSPPVELWWHASRWTRITSREACSRNMWEPAPRVLVKDDDDLV